MAIADTKIETAGGNSGTNLNSPAATTTGGSQLFNQGNGTYGLAPAGLTQGEKTGGIQYYTANNGDQYYNSGNGTFINRSGQSYGQPTNTLTSGDANADATAVQNDINQRSNDLIATQQKNLQAALESQSKSINTRYDQQVANKQKVQNEENLTNTAAQFRLGRSGTDYANSATQKLNDIHGQQIDAINQQRQDLIQQANQAYITGNISLAKELIQADQAALDQQNKLKEQQAKAKQDQFDNQIKMAQEARAVEEFTQKKQEFTQKNIALYASNLIGTDPTGELVMPDNAEIQALADATGLDPMLVLGSVRDKYRELSKMSKEDRKLELDIQTAKQNLVPQMYQEYDEAITRGEWKQSMGDVFDFMRAKELAKESPLDRQKKLLDIQKLQKDLTETEGMSDDEKRDFLTISKDYQQDSFIKNGINMEVAKETADQVLKDPTSATNQLKILYTLIKALDPNSAVKEGETQLANDTQSYLNQFGVKFGKIENNQALSPELTKEFANGVKELADQWIKAASKKEQTFRSQARQVGVEGQFNDFIKGSKEIYKDEQPEKKTFTGIEDLMQHASQTEIDDFNALQASFPEKSLFEVLQQFNQSKSFNEPGSVGASAQTGMRTDRHNNPTAFTTDIARIAGLQEGVDYTIGDPFSGGKYHTANIIGNPIDKTIQVIDKIGFYTKNGNQRWTHTAIPQSQWNSMSYDEKKNVIKQMYQHEGGTKLKNKFV